MLFGKKELYDLSGDRVRLDFYGQDSELCIFLILATMIQIWSSSVLKSRGPHLSLPVPPCLRDRVPRQAVPCAIFLRLFLAVACLSGAWPFAQSTSDNPDTIRGIVINSATREPIARALVSSPGNRLATMTNSEGRFEFNLPRVDTASGSGSGSNAPPGRSIRSYSLMARKPGFLTDPNSQANNIRNNPSKDLTLALTPEAVIVGSVTLPTAEAPDSITLQIFRRQVQDGRGHYVPAGGAQSASDGQFRFSDLPAGTYKLLTNELLDRDPLTADPFASDSRGPLFGYPPVYYQSASDFGAASTIQLAAGQTQNVNLSLVKQPYYRVKVPVVVPVTDGGENGVSVEVYAHGHKGPGFSLGYNNRDHAIEGMLPDGIYTIEASSSGPNRVIGLETLIVKGAPSDGRTTIDGPRMALVPNASIPVYVREEFTSAARDDGNAALRKPHDYLSLALESADDFGMDGDVPLRNPTGPGDGSLAIEGAPPGLYWVRVQSSRGYPASIRSGNLDLLHQPLVVGVGGGASPIEITMRDDAAEISGTVEGITPPTPGSARVPGSGQARAHVYCIPVADSSGRFTEIWVRPDGSFVSQGLAPGTYRVLAFDQVQAEIEYRNPEAMRAYDSKGQVVRVAGGQKERVQLQLISTSIAGNEE